MREIYLQRLNRFYEWMKKRDLATALISSPVNIYYFTGFYSNPHERFLGLFLTKGREPILITPELDVTKAKNNTFVKEIYGYSDSEGPIGLLEKFIPLKQGVFGFEENVVSFKKAQWLKEVLRYEQSIDIEEGIMALRMIKDELELRYMREAARGADQAISYGVEAAKVGKSELEIIAEVEYRLKKQGIEKMSFDTMVLTGLKSASPHGKPGNNKIVKGDFVLFDLGVMVNGYCSDISRTVIIGKPTTQQKEVYTTVQQGQQRALNIIQPNIKMKDVDLAAREYFNQMGYGKYFIHRIGHGLGLDVHEYPSVHEKNEESIVEGMVFTVEPGLYLPEIGGVRIEDDVVVKREGVEVLTSFTKELIEV